MSEDALEEGASLMGCVSQQKQERIDRKETSDRNGRGLRIN